MGSQKPAVVFREGQREKRKAQMAGREERERAAHRWQEAVWQELWGLEHAQKWSGCTAGRRPEHKACMSFLHTGQKDS